MFWKRLLCVRKFPCVLKKTVVFPNRLLCSRKDCCVLKNIVVFSKTLLCPSKDCCVSEQKLSCVLPLWATVCRPVNTFLKLFQDISVCLLLRYASRFIESKKHESCKSADLQLSCILLSINLEAYRNNRQTEMS